MILFGKNVIADLLDNMEQMKNAINSLDEILAVQLELKKDQMNLDLLTQKKDPQKSIYYP